LIICPGGILQVHEAFFFIEEVSYLTRFLVIPFKASIDTMLSDECPCGYGSITRCRKSGAIAFHRIPEADPIPNKRMNVRSVKSFYIIVSAPIQADDDSVTWFLREVDNVENLSAMHFLPSGVVQFKVRFSTHVFLLNKVLRTRSSKAGKFLGVAAVTNYVKVSFSLSRCLNNSLAGSSSQDY
jgi:hypothetical protein